MTFEEPAATSLEWTESDFSNNFSSINETPRGTNKLNKLRERMLPNIIRSVMFTLALQYNCLLLRSIYLEIVSSV